MTQVIYTFGGLVRFETKCSHKTFENIFMFNIVEYIGTPG